MLPELNSTVLDERIYQLQYSILALRACRDPFTPAQREVIDIEIHEQTQMIERYESLGGRRANLHREERRPHTGGKGAWNGRA